MAEGDLYLNCTTAELSWEDILRVVCVDGDCETLFIDCDNDELSAEDIFRLLVREDANGNPAIAVCGCEGGGGGGVFDEGDADRVSVLAGTPVSPTFSSPFSANDYTLHINIYGAGGASVGFTLDSSDVNGFTVTPTANGTMHWSAVKV